MTLQQVAGHADIWNCFGTPEEIGRKNRVLDDWCVMVDRDPAAIERSIWFDTLVMEDVEAYVEQGMTHLIYGVRGPDCDLGPLHELIQWRDQRST